jgi:hypothetical protein
LITDTVFELLKLFVDSFAELILLFKSLVELSVFGLILRFVLCDCPVYPFKACFHVFADDSRFFCLIMDLDDGSNAFHILGQLDNVPGDYWWNVVPIMGHIRRPFESETVIQLLLDKSGHKVVL